MIENDRFERWTQPHADRRRAGTADRHRGPGHGHRAGARDCRGAGRSPGQRPGAERADPRSVSAFDVRRTSRTPRAELSLRADRLGGRVPRADAAGDARGGQPVPEPVRVRPVGPRRCRTVPL